MIDLSSIEHIPMSNYAFSDGVGHFVFRVRTKRKGVDEVSLLAGDTAEMVNPIHLSKTKMDRIGRDDIYDYYECRIGLPFVRVSYCFSFIKGKETAYFYSGHFHRDISSERNDLFKYPYSRKDGIGHTPEWLKGTVFYNIFPDSFVSQDKALREPRELIEKGGTVIKNRLGGNLKEIRDHLGYIKDLGFNGVYLNPLFKAEEYHKYDTIDYLTIDPMFGTNEEFKNFVAECHSRGIKVMIDMVFNHCGWNFPPFLDVIKSQEHSKYKDWFYHLDFPVFKPAQPNVKPPYASFGYERMMPKLNTSNPEVVSYFDKVISFYERDCGVDGFRLDSSDELNDDFIIHINRTIKAVNPLCAIIGEIWQNPYHWVNNQMMDGAMNYDFRKACLSFLKGELSGLEFSGYVNELTTRLKDANAFAMLNLLDSHDVPRLYSEVGENMDVFRLGLVMLFSSIGPVNFLYGDEIPLKGIKEKDYRGPMNYEDNGQKAFVKELVKLRLDSPELISGRLLPIYASRSKPLYAFKRVLGEHAIEIVLNNGSGFVGLGSIKGLNPKGKILLSQNLASSFLGPHSFVIRRY